MPKAQTDEAQSNRLLGALEPASRKRIDLHLQPVTLKLGAVVCEAGGQLKHAYFPKGSVLSLLTVLENGSAIETANIGREGAFGLFAAMYSRVSFNRCVVQLEGDMVRCPIALLQSEFRNSEHVPISSSATRKRCCHKFNSRLRAIPCIQQKRECADGCS
jgi:hypothetical protein